jgi:hypothetical protein
VTGESGERKMLGDSVEKRKNIVWRDYDRSMFSI